MNPIYFGFLIETRDISVGAQAPGPCFLPACGTVRRVAAWRCEQLNSRAGNCGPQSSPAPHTVPVRPRRITRRPWDTGRNLAPHHQRRRL